MRSRYVQSAIGHPDFLAGSRFDLRHELLDPFIVMGLVLAGQMNASRSFHNSKGRVFSMRSVQRMTSSAAGACLEAVPASVTQVGQGQGEMQMGVYRVKALIPAPLPRVWEFIVDPRNQP